MPIAAKQLDASQQIIIPLAIDAHVTTGGYTVIGGDEFDPSLLPSDNRTIQFVVRFLTTNIANDGYVRLYNVTDGLEVIEFQTNSLNVDKQFMNLTAAVDIPNSEKTYEVQSKIIPSDGVQSVICQKSEFRIKWK